MWNGVDRRKFPRAEYPCLITIRKYVPPELAILTHTENISIGGVRVIVDHRIDTATEVDLEIDLKDTMPNIASRGAIRWVREIEPKAMPAAQGRNTKVFKGTVSWVEEIPPAKKGLPRAMIRAFNLSRLKKTTSAGLKIWCKIFWATRVNRAWQSLSISTPLPSLRASLKACWKGPLPTSGLPVKFLILSNIPRAICISASRMPIACWLAFFSAMPIKISSLN